MLKNLRKRKKKKFKGTWRQKAGFLWLILLAYIFIAVFILKIKVEYRILIGFVLYLTIYETINALFFEELILEKKK